MKVIGYSIGTKSQPNTPEEFHFWLAPEEESVTIGTIVKLESSNNFALGVVEEMKSYSEVEDLYIHAFARGFDPLLSPPNREGSVVVCRARVIKQSQEKPIKEGPVLYPEEEELEELFNLEGCNIPFGVFVNSDGTSCPVKVNEDYILGYEGAHVNISGMSGLGTKTSTFLFLLSSIFTHARSRVACIIFNIKSDDLLYIDEVSQSLEEEDLRLYRTLDIAPGGFKSRFFAPSGRKGASSLRSDIEIFRWGYSEIKDYLTTMLKAGSEDQKEKLDTAYLQLKTIAKRKGYATFEEILDFMERELLPQGKNGSDLIMGSYKATWGKLYNSLKGLENRNEGLITVGEDVVELPYEEIEDREVWVIDIQQLSFYPRKLVFEKVIREFVSRLEEKKLKVDKLIIFMDELNKYAPPQASRDVASLKEKLIDIAARGRSIGVSLFSAQQFKSRVDANILGNISTDIYGKTKQSELQEPIYKKFTEEIKGKMRRFGRGDKLLDHELFEAPVFVKIPRPPCMLGSEKAKLRQVMCSAM